MFHPKKRYSSKVVSRAKLNPMLAPHVILSDEKRSEWMQTIYATLNFSSVKQAQLIKPLLEEVVGGCQLLPSNQHIFYTQSGGLLDFALFRAQSAILLFKQFVLPPNTQELSEEQARYAYLIFSAALLRGIGCLYTDYTVNLYNTEGHLLSHWQPLWERLIDRAEFYQQQTNPSPSDELRAHTTPLIARIWMPQAGLAWLSEDKEAFLSWLKLLQEEKEGFNILEAILERAESLAWQELARLALANLPSANLAPDSRLPSFVENPNDDKLRLQAIGLEFILWIKENLARGQMLINQPPLNALHNGLLISEDAFRGFLQHHPQFKNWRLIQQGLMSLGIHEKQFQQQAQNEQGLLIKNPGHILPKEIIAKLSQNAQHTKIQSLLISTNNQWKQFAQNKVVEKELLKKRLNAQGHWQEFQISESPTPGMSNG